MQNCIYQLACIICSVILVRYSKESYIFYPQSQAIDNDIPPVCLASILNTIETSRLLYGRTTMQQL